MAETIGIKVKQVIGTGDPFDGTMLIPLITNWRVPRNCLAAVWTGQECERPLRRLYLLDEPIQGHGVVGVCEDHHQELQLAAGAQPERTGT